MMCCKYLEPRLLSEYRLLPRQRLKLNPVVQMYINHTLVTALEAKAFIGLPASNLLDIVFLPSKAFSEIRMTAEQVAVLTENLRTSLQAMHKKSIHPP